MHYKRVHNARAFEDKGRDAVLAGRILIVCRDCNTPCTFSEICAFTDIPKEEANVAYNPIEGFLASAHDETVQHSACIGRSRSLLKVELDGLGENRSIQDVFWIGQDANPWSSYLI
jgi:transcription initiation factor TFIIIB Brf1 subunit/transcription initiation factor TFIIB